MGLEKQSNETVQLQADTVKSHPSLTRITYQGHYGEISNA